MTYKVKPIEKADIRERVEKKFRARGSLLFHALLLAGGSVLFLAYLPTVWENRFLLYERGLYDATMFYGILTLSFALHFIRYHFKHGVGYERHEAETERKITRQLRKSNLEDAEEREDLIRAQQNDKLKNRRLLLQHFSLFLGLGSLMIFLHWSQIVRYTWFDAEAMMQPLYLVGAWGIGMAAHALRYFFAYGYSAEKRQAKIAAEVARELAVAGKKRSAVTSESQQERPSQAQLTQRDDLIESNLVDDGEQRHIQSRA